MFSLSFSPRFKSGHLDKMSGLMFAFPGLWWRVKLYSPNSDIHLACRQLSFWGFLKYSTGDFDDLSRSQNLQLSPSDIVATPPAPSLCPTSPCRIFRSFSGCHSWPWTCMPLDATSPQSSGRALCPVRSLRHLPLP